MKTAAPVLKDILDPTKAIIDQFVGKTADIKQFAEDVKTLGIERAEEAKRVRESVAALEKDNIVKKEAVALAEAQAKAQKEATDAVKSRKATQFAEEFRKSTEEIQKQNKERIVGVKEATVQANARLRDYIATLEKQGNSTEKATELAKERVKAEQQASKLQENRQRRSLESRAVGVARNARSVEAATRKQQRVEEERFKKSQSILSGIAEVLGEIKDNNNRFDIGII